MRLAIHNPHKKSKTSRRKRRAANRNGESTMAKAKKKKKKGATRRRSNARRRTSSKRRKNAVYASNPGNPRKRSSKRRTSSKRRKNAVYASNPGNPRRSSRRRRNPSILKHPAVRVGIAAGAGVLAAVVASVGAALVQPHGRIAQLAVAGAGLAAGGYVATKDQAIGGAIAGGALGAVALQPLVEKAYQLIASSPTPGGGVAAIRRRNELAAIRRRNELGAFNPHRQRPWEAMTPWGPATG